MKFREYVKLFRREDRILEIIDLDKKLTDINKPSIREWEFNINGIFYKVSIIQINREDGRGNRIQGFIIYLYIHENGKWVTSYRTSKINAGIIGSKIVSILYDIITKHNPDILILSTSEWKLMSLYDLVWQKHGKTKPFNGYVISKNDDNTTMRLIKGNINLTESVLFDIEKEII